MTTYTVWQNSQPVARCDDKSDARHCYQKHAKDGPAELRAGAHRPRKTIPYRRFDGAPAWPEN